MFITFLYELDRSLWPQNWQRPFSSYLERLDTLLPKLDETIVFGEDDRVKEIALRHSKEFFFKKKEAWKSWNNLERIRKAIQKKFSWVVPQLFSAEYICIQLSKFDAIKEVTSIYSRDNYVWIDGGLHEKLQERPIIVKLKNPLLHISLIGPPRRYIADADYFIMGGCFGGRKVDLEWFADEVDKVNEDLLAKDLCGNDQQIMSIIYNEHPKRFAAWRSYVINFGPHNQVSWHHLTDCINDDAPQLPDHTRSYIYSILLFLFLFLLLRVYRK